MQDYDIICIGSEDSSMAFALAQTGREALLLEIVGFVRNEKKTGKLEKRGRKVFTDPMKSGTVGRRFDIASINWLLCSQRTKLNKLFIWQM